MGLAKTTTTAAYPSAPASKCPECPEAYESDKMLLPTANVLSQDVGVDQRATSWNPSHHGLAEGEGASTADACRRVEEDVAAGHARLDATAVAARDADAERRLAELEGELWRRLGETSQPELKRALTMVLKALAQKNPTADVSGLNLPGSSDCEAKVASAVTSSVPNNGSNAVDGDAMCTAAATETASSWAQSLEPASLAVTRRHKPQAQVQTGQPLSPKESPCSTPQSTPQSTTTSCPSTSASSFSWTSGSARSPPRGAGSSSSSSVAQPRPSPRDSVPRLSLGAVQSESATGVFSQVSSREGTPRLSRGASPRERPSRLSFGSSGSRPLTASVSPGRQRQAAELEEFLSPLPARVACQLRGMVCRLLGELCSLDNRLTSQAKIVDDLQSARKAQPTLDVIRQRCKEAQELYEQQLEAVPCALTLSRWRLGQANRLALDSVDQSSQVQREVGRLHRERVELSKMLEQMVKAEDDRSLTTSLPSGTTVKGATHEQTAPAVCESPKEDSALAKAAAATAAPVEPVPQPSPRRSCGPPKESSSAIECCAQPLSSPRRAPGRPPATGGNCSRAGCRPIAQQTPRGARHSLGRKSPASVVVPAFGRKADDAFSSKCLTTRACVLEGDSQRRRSSVGFDADGERTPRAATCATAAAASEAPPESTAAAVESETRVTDIPPFCASVAYASAWEAAVETCGKRQPSNRDLTQALTREIEIRQARMSVLEKEEAAFKEVLEAHKALSERLSNLRVGRAGAW